MSKRKYTHIQMLLPEIREMISVGKTHKEIEQYFNLTGDRPVHNLLKRERRKEKKIQHGIPVYPKGRPEKGRVKLEKEKDYEIKRLKMENELLRDFLRLAGRK